MPSRATDLLIAAPSYFRQLTLGIGEVFVNPRNPTVSYTFGINLQVLYKSVEATTSLLRLRPCNQIFPFAEALLLPGRLKESSQITLRPLGNTRQCTQLRSS